jgi:hypothetical protein
MNRRSTRALALLCLLGSSLLAPIRATAGTASTLARRERMVLLAAPIEDASGCGFYFFTEFDLTDPGGQPRGTLSLFSVPLSPPEVPDEDATGILTFVATLEDGSIVGQGRFPLNDDPTLVAIVGGTGRYRRMRGYARIVPRDEGAGRLVLHLLR